MGERIEQISRRVDHVVLEAGDEEQLFSFLTDTLGLPIAWPLAQWGPMHEGGVRAGNCNLGCNHVLDPASDPAPTVRAVALEPAAELPSVVEELQRRGFSPTEPIASGPIDLPDTEAFAPWRRGWTTVFVFDGPLDPLPFICAYDHDVVARRRSERVAFDATGRGPLGIIGLRAIVIHTDDVERAATAWAALLGEKTRVSQDVVALPEGPEFRFQAGVAAPALVFGVRSVDAALAEARVLGIRCDQGQQVRLDPDDTLGIDIRLE